MKRYLLILMVTNLLIGCESNLGGSNADKEKVVRDKFFNYITQCGDSLYVSFNRNPPVIEMNNVNIEFENSPLSEADILNTPGIEWRGRAILKARAMKRVTV